MMGIETKDQLQGLQTDLVDYMQHTRKTPAEALAHQTEKLRLGMRKGLREKMPPRSEIKTELEARLKSGRGIEVRGGVRDSVYDKAGAQVDPGSGKIVFGRRLVGSTVSRRRTEQGVVRRRTNLQARAVRAEIALRARSRGYLSYSMELRDWRSLSRTARENAVERGITVSQRDRQRAEVARLESEHAGPDNMGIRLTARSKRIDRKTQTGGIGGFVRKYGIDQQAIREVRADIHVYLRRKHQEAVRKSFKKRGSL